MITLFGNTGREPLLHLSGDNYPNLVREFYATVLHKIDKTLQTIISTMKRVHIVGIRNEGNTNTVDFNRKTLQEDLD